MYENTSKLPKTYRNGSEIEDGLFQKGSKDMANFFKDCRGTSILIHPRHSSVHFSIDATNYEACQDAHHSGLRNVRNGQNCS